MNRKKISFVCTGVLLLAFSSAWTQVNDGDDQAEVTIRLMDAAEVELPQTVTGAIQLPASLREDSAAVENARSGLDTANENRQRREEGLATADEARERAADMADEALQNRENRGRSEDLPERPDMPDLPDVPQPPNG